MPMDARFARGVRVTIWNKNAGGRRNCELRLATNQTVIASWVITWFGGLKLFPPGCKKPDEVTIMNLLVKKGKTYDLSLNSPGTYTAALIALRPITVYGLKILTEIVDPHERMDPRESPHLAIAKGTRGLKHLKPD